MEYALIVALVSVGLILALTGLRDSIGAVFDSIQTQLGTAEVDQYQSGGAATP